MKAPQTPASANHAGLYRPGRRTYGPFALLLILLASPMAIAEVLSPPPIPADPWANGVGIDSPLGILIGQTSFFPESYSWMAIERYSHATGRPLFAWDFDLGAHVVIAHHPLFVISGLARLLYQNEVTGDIRFSINPSAIVTDLHLRARFPQLPLEPAVWYRHDCKHDIARQRRDLIHDVIGANARYRFAREFASGAVVAVDLLGTLEYQIPLIFQDYEANGNVAAAFLSVQPSIDLGTLDVFLETRGSILLDDPDSDLAPAGQWRFDGLVRAGVSWPDQDQGATVYAQLEHITDPWRMAVAETEPVTVFSVGLIFAGR